ncbi:MAG: asparagine--tRNA ligase [Bacteroidota bacterium]
MSRIEIKQVLQTEPQEQVVLVKGWVKTFRANRFIALNDGSTSHNVQVVVEFENYEEDFLKRIATGAALSVEGKLVASQGKGQAVEVLAEKIEILGDADPAVYPIQPKKHSLEFLREKAHLRMRTQTFSAVFRIRHAVAYAIHSYFNENGFYYLHTPIITGSDAEGAGEMFRVTTLPPENPPKTDEGEINYKEDFFGKATNLTVSGQLQAESGAMALGKVYTFGPTFRAENSNTTRHLAEFWMIEPEAAFFDLQDNADMAQDFLKYIIRYAMDHCADDLDFLDKRIQQEEKNMPANQRRSMGLMDTLRFVVDNEFAQITYTEAIDTLKRSKPYKKKKFQYPVEWGNDLQSEHERYLVEKEFKKPVIVTDYPKVIKAFYMRLNDDEQTVAAMDILFPGIGEVVGGSQREERMDVLKARMAEVGVHEEELNWYLDLRRFGTAPHAGFGLGFERILLFITGMSNIRDVIPFPRAPKSAEF